MSVLYRVLGSTDLIPLTINPAATTTPTVTLYTDAGRTVPYGGAARVLTGSGTSWSYSIADLPLGTYYLHEQATTTGGTVSSDADSLVILAGSIGSAGTGVTLAQAREHLNYDDPTDTDDDDEIQFFVDAANEWIATAVSDLTPTPVQLGTLELVRHLWETQRGPAEGGLDGDEIGGRGFLGFAIPNRVRELIEPWATGKITGGSPVGSFPDATVWPDPLGRWVW